MNDLVAALNLIYLVTFVILATIVLGRLIYRAFLYIRAKEPVPLLLKRDIPLFAVVVVQLGIIAVARVAGIVLAGIVLWVIASGTATVVALAYWAYVEYFRIGD